MSEEEFKVSNMFIDSLKTQQELYYKAKMEELVKNKMDIFIECYKNGMIFGAPTDIEFYGKIATLQQKVEQLEKENKRLKEWKEDLLSENIELENIRKEAIEYLESDENIIDRFWKHDFRKYPDYNPFEEKDEEEVRCVELYGYDDLLNILNKGSDK